MAGPTIDDLLKAIETVQILQDTIAKHDQLLGRIIDKLEAFEKRLAVVEAREVDKP